MVFVTKTAVLVTRHRQYCQSTSENTLLRSITTRTQPGTKV